MTELLDAALSYIESHRSELCALASKLIELRTPNPPGSGQGDFAVWVRGWLEEAGLVADLLPTSSASNPVPSAPVVIARLGPPEGKNFCLQGHYDTVGPASGWLRDPYRATIEGNRLYGLGASDMKGALAAMMMAGKALASVGFAGNGNLTLLFSPDEEYPGGPGIRFLIGQDMIRPDWLVSGEPSGLDQIHVGMKGAFWGDITFYGRSAHGSTPFWGTNAFEHFLRFARRIDERVRSLLDSGESPYPVTPPDHQRSTLVLGGIVKGTNGARSVVPDYFSTSFDIRVLPSPSQPPVLEVLEEELNSYVAEHPGITAELKVSSRMPGYVLPGDSDKIQMLMRCVAAVTGKEPTLTCSSGAMETALFVAAGIPALVFGPGRWECSHCPDEFILTDDMVAAAKVYALLAVEALS